MIAAEWIAIALTGYACAGLLFALLFVCIGMERVDPAARGSRFGFRLIMLPGVAALWPLLLRRWVVS